jgi:hypothetical protein
MAKQLLPDKQEHPGLLFALWHCNKTPARINPVLIYANNGLHPVNLKISLQKWPFCFLSRAGAFRNKKLKRFQPPENFVFVT